MLTRALVCRLVRVMLHAVLLAAVFYAGLAIGVAVAPEPVLLQVEMPGRLVCR